MEQNIHTVYVPTSIVKLKWMANIIIVRKYLRENDIVAFAHVNIHKKIPSMK